MTPSHLSAERLGALRAGGEPGDDEASHLLDCEACSLALEGDDELARSLGAARRVEPEPWGEERVRAGQARLASAVGRRKAVRYASPVVAVALAAAAAWALASRPPASGPIAGPALAEVEKQPDAALALAQSGPDEVVEVSRGQASFKVRKLKKAERFRVKCGRDEVEVRGTQFVVRGGDKGFASVEVSEGAVELRTECCGTRLLRAGDSWSRPEVAGAPTAEPSPGPTALAPPSAAEPATPGPTAREPGPKGAAPPPAPREPEPTADALRQRALEAYDGGHYALAAKSFEAAAHKAPDAAWAGDARTLAGAARVLQAPAGSIASLPVGVASLDAAAQRAARSGDSARAAAARVAAARRSSGEGARKRWCALRHDPLVSADVRGEAARACGDAP
ncbi:MAG TPA: FecR family protein [Polyangiaceae bacterium]|nr:FecR family protein [Polyangiaceae bacterium]